MSNKEVEFDVRYIFGKIPFNLQLTQFTWLLMVGFLLSNRGVLRGSSSLFSVLSLPSEICGTVRCRRDRCWPSDVCSFRAGVRQGFCLCNKTETSPLPNMRDMGFASTELFSRMHYGATVTYPLHTGSGASMFLLLWLLLGLRVMSHLSCMTQYSPSAPGFRNLHQANT